MKSNIKILVSAVAVIAIAVSCATSPTGRRQLVAVSAAEMDQMGAQAFAELKQKQKVSKDPAVNRYVQCVTDALVKELNAEGAPEKWEVRVFDDPSANAFALPGGYIGVHTGLLKVAQTPDQLAAVIGHEIGHVIAEHGNERVSHGLATQVGMTVASIAIDTDTKQGQVWMGLLGAGAQFGILLPFSRTHESEADTLGARYMARAGFDPRASIELWKNMKKASGGSPPQWLSTHPNPDTRIDDLEDEMSNSLKIYEKARSQGINPSCRRS